MDQIWQELGSIDMEFKDFMQFLADNYIVGISVACVVVIAVYLVFSIRLMISARREGINACASALIPIYNLILWVRKWRRKKKNSATLAEDEEIEL